jgi:hypothetical protein
MSRVDLHFSMQFRPIYAILQDGLERLFEVMKSDCFEFEVEGQKIESTFAEAVLISPIISNLLKSDSTMNQIRINDTNISATSFTAFLRFVRCHDHHISCGNSNLKNHRPSRDRAMSISYPKIYSKSMGDLLKSLIDSKTNVIVDDDESGLNHQ